MSAVFEFDEDLTSHTLQDDELPAIKEASPDPDADRTSIGGQESGYASENDAAESASVPSDEKLYEVQLDEDYISSSVKGSDKLVKKVGKDDFQIICLLGRGAYGKVTLCRHIATQRLYAMKVLKKASLFVHAKTAEHTKAERQILEEVRHPFIVQLMYAFQTDNRLYLILEYATGGELFSHMATEQMFDESTTRFYVAELVLALEHLHSLGIVYRDLKPENCLLDAKGHILLTDFGLCKVSLDGRASTFCGTAEYMAPEILMEMHYDKNVDWWSLGVLMYEMLTGYTPFRSGNQKKTMDAIQKRKLHVPYFVSADAKDLLVRLLRKNPNQRLGSGEDGAKKIKASGWFRRIDWALLEKRELDPPIVPIVTDPALAENFDDKFTHETIKETPIDASLDANMQDYFANFSYVAQSTLLAKDTFEHY